MIKLVSRFKQTVNEKLYLENKHLCSRWQHDILQSATHKIASLFIMVSKTVFLNFFLKLVLYYYHIYNAIWILIIRNKGIELKIELNTAATLIDNIYCNSNYNLFNGMIYTDSTDIIFQFFKKLFGQTCF